jgi:hypothetical protein
MGGFQHDSSNTDYMYCITENLQKGSAQNGAVNTY